MTYRRWTDSEKQRIARLWIDGLTPSAIAERMGTSRRMIGRIIEIMGLKRREDCA